MKTTFFHLALLLVAAPTMALGAEPSSRPNILYFYVDDMGWGSIGPNGQAERKAKGLPYVRTPNLDQLAARGLNFTRGYGCHVCSPARSSQQSGFHQGHTFADRNDPNNAKKAMRSDDVLMGDALSAAGYNTGYWGKWGYGGSKDQVAPVIENVQTLPTSHGYEHVLAELHHVRAHTFFQPTLWSAPAAQGAIGGLELVPNSLAKYQNKDAYPNLPARQDLGSYPEVSYCDDAYAFAALDFVRDQGMAYNQTGKPFFGLLAVQIPHAPFGEISELPGWDSEYAYDPKFADLADQTRQWAAMVTRIDAHFGNILAALEDPNQDGDRSDSIANNTLVVFQSDNGGPSGKNNIELNANGGLRGNKGQIQEGGIRVPLIIRWPAMIHSKSALKPGTNCDKVVDVTDLFPTFCEVAQAKIPVGIDGVSIAPTLTGIGKQREREFIIHEAGNGQSIIRGSHKLVRASKSKRQEPSLSLFDLDADPTEANDIAGDHPDLVAELETLLLGERVAEPKGFANTYHHWIGTDGSSASDPSNWSDYIYENADVTYMTDDGPPRLSWNATIANRDGKANRAEATHDLEFLGLEISGGSAPGASQSLHLASAVNLTGRNEIRLAKNSELRLNGGKVSSLRWIAIEPSAVLRGNGVVEGDLHNQGSVVVAGKPISPLHVRGAFSQSPEGSLEITSLNQAQPSLQITEQADLNGMLALVLESSALEATGAPFVILKADKIVGRFLNDQSEVVTADGKTYEIGYTATTVTLKAK